MKKAIAINGGPRKQYNTAMLLQEALKGAEAAGAETEIIHLTDLNFRGCVSCFGCKRLGNPNFGKCNLKDDLAPVFEKIEQADVLLVGSPIYLGDVTGMTRNFIERLLFQYITYNADRVNSWKGKKLNCGFVFTQNCPMERSDMYVPMYNANTNNLKFFGGSAEYLVAAETWQFDDYSKYACSMFDVEDRRRRREEEFPLKLQEAFEMGRRLTENA